MAAADLPDDKTEEINHDLLPDNTVTIIVKVNGKVYSSGAHILALDDETPDEDLDSTMRAIRGLMQSAQRTIFYTIAGRDEKEPLPE